MTRVSIVKYVFLGVGLLFVVIALVTTMNTRTFVAEANHAQGTVIDMVRRQSTDSDHSDAYAPVVRFVTTGGETVEFTSNTSSNPPSYARGEAVAVLYRPLTPHDAKINSFGSLWGAPVMFGVLGSIFAAGGGGFILFGVLKARKAADLKLHGVRFLTTVQRIERNENVKLNGVNPYRIFTEWRNPAKHEIRRFESDYVWFDPSTYLDGRNIPVYVAPGDPDTYYVDLSFLPKSVT